jgi:hypothetical protein
VVNVNPIDWDRSTCLCDVGMPGWAAIMCIGPDGDRHALLVDQATLGSSYNPDVPHATHEQPGPLPPRWRDRVQLAPLRCGRRTKSGTSCRAYVGHPGEACGWHRTEARQ